jgi:hypothetical protein
VIADKGYDIDALLEKIKALGASAVIPPKPNRKESMTRSFTKSAT